MFELAHTLLLVVLLVIHILPASAKANFEPCKWKSFAGASYDLTPLEIRSGDLSYHLKDGDIPCSGVHEPVYSFMWNFCAQVTDVSMPSGICEPEQRGAAIQYLNRTSDGYKECHVIGRYDRENDQNEWNLLDSKDPSKGVTMKYSAGERCPNGAQRSATIDVVCKNTHKIIDSALEPEKCQYHMVMHSWHGCPQECPVNGGGLCNSHGHCAYDKAKKKAMCYCNDGWSGAGCDLQSTSLLDISASNGTYYHNVQVGLLVVLLLIAMGLIAIVIFMVYRIAAYRKEHMQDYYSLQFSSDQGEYSEHGTEML